MKDVSAVGFQAGEHYLNFIGGEWTGAASGDTDANVSPAEPSLIVGYVPKAGRSELDRAALAARTAYSGWRKLSGPARGDYLYRIADALERRLDDIAETMTREMGKTFPEAKGETARGVAILRYYAGEGMRSAGDVIPSTDSEALMFTTRVPLGVVGVISPWNFPVAIPIWKIAPALVYGNTVVFKPAREGAVTAAKVVECFAEAKLPPGVLNLVTGDGAELGGALVAHPEVNAVTFTGSNAVGKRIAATAAARGIKYQLEMGGKNPVIVASDADLDQAVEATISGGLRSTGQKCTATSRVIVLRDVYEAFKAKLLARIAGLKVGDGMASDTWMGPCASKAQYDKVLSYIRQGEAEGARLLCGGQAEREQGQGYYVSPAVFDQVEPGMTIAREEIFGPVLALMKVDTLEEALRLANDSEFGLSASIFTKNIGAMLTFIQEMDAGLVRINAESAGVELQAPFGGMKQSSSHSREQGRAALEFYTATKTVFIKS